MGEVGVLPKRFDYEALPFALVESATTLFGGKPSQKFWLGIAEGLDGMTTCGDRALELAIYEQSFGILKVS